MVKNKLSPNFLQHGVSHVNIYFSHNIMDCPWIKWSVTHHLSHSSDVFVWLIINYLWHINRKMSTSQIIFDRLPLPKQTFVGYWTVGQATTGMQKLLCPAETQLIDIKVDIFLWFSLKLLNLTVFSLCISWETFLIILRTHYLMLI